MKAILEYRGPDREPAQFEVPPEGTILIGRGMDNDVLARHPTVARKHARLHGTADGRFFLADLGSCNGTRLNGEELRVPQPLMDGDVIHVGAFELRFRLEP